MPENTGIFPPETEDGVDWQNGLQLSNLPIELSAAACLTDQGFIVETDFKATAGKTPTMGTLAVDLYAVGQVPFTDPHRTTAQADLLVECRFRHPKTAWLFLPDPNDPEKTPYIKMRAVRAIDQFSPVVISPRVIMDFESRLPLCYKGVEIDRNDWSSREEGVQEGLFYLQTALPRLFTENVILRLEEKREGNVPFFFCPILLTTSRLFVLKTAVTPESVSRAGDFSDVADEVDCVKMYRGYDPAFESVCAKECRKLETLVRNEQTIRVNQMRARRFNTHFNLPFHIIESLTTGHYFYLHLFFTQFLICTTGRFPSLVREICDAVSRDVENGEDLD